MERYICVHGHFYQPPRDNPWLECLEVQDSAYPYHDWNQRITAESYAPNAASRILDGEGRIVQIANNYAKMSFNFGPTLMAWMEPNAPDVYEAILEAERESQKAFSGHGSALAQPYNHMIMPLANRRDKYAQALWGLRDFEHRFGRKPEGMWLPETAVDLETLNILAELGIRFTVLAPHQAQRVRRIGDGEWKDVSGAKIDPRQPYVQSLSHDRTIAVFFYDGPISRSVAFEGLLSKGEEFAKRLLSAFSGKSTGPELVHIATDGETYGHHHRFGDMALAYALHHIQSNNLARLTNYGEYLEKHPPANEVEIVGNTSWSCTHGVERWRSGCGCNTGTHPGWNQAWRGPLREAMDWLRDTLAPRYEEKAGHLLKDPWIARNDYIGVILDRSPESRQRFLSQHAAHELDGAEQVTAWKLLELQRHAMLMYTSCGWFFEELSGIETVQVIQYAGRALQLAQQVFGDDIEGGFLELLGKAKSNIPAQGDGRIIYEKSVKPALLDATRVAAHYAVSSLFEDYTEQVRIYSYQIDREDFQSPVVGKARVAVGRARVTSVITQESSLLAFGVLHFGDHNLNAGVREYRGERAYTAMAKEIFKTFWEADFPDVIRLLDKHFGTSTYSLKSLFRDEQRKVLARILESVLSEVESEYRQIYEGSYAMMRFLTELGNPLPKGFHSAAEFILNTNLRWALSSDTLDPERIKGLLDEANLWRVELDTEGLSYLLELTLGRMMARLKSEPGDGSRLEAMLEAVALTRLKPFAVNLWKAQNLYYEVMRANYAGFQEKAQQGDEAAREWVTQFVSLGEQLSMRVP